MSAVYSGVKARQDMDLNNASTAYNRAAMLQNGRKGKPKNKYTIWLRSLAARHGKDKVRAAARDIQRCYRGMLGREDAAYERLQRKKKLKAQQAAILTQQRKAATALVQRVYRGHRARLQAAWRRRMRAARTLAAVRLEAALRGLNVRTRAQHSLQLARTARAAALLQARLSILSLSPLSLALSLSPLVCA